MVDEMPSGASGAFTCPWCSTPYQGPADTCPSCGATIEGETVDPALPGLTAIDAAAIVRAKTPVARPRNRFLSWISGEYPDDTPSVTEAGALAPPDLDVRREMLRLELEAEVANLQAEADSLLADATVEGLVPEPTMPAATTDAAAVDASVVDAAVVDAEPREGEAPPPPA
jgi:hypothetical protein